MYGSHILFEIYVIHRPYVTVCILTVVTISMAPRAGDVGTIVRVFPAVCILVVHTELISATVVELVPMIMVCLIPTIILVGSVFMVILQLPYYERKY